MKVKNILTCLGVLLFLLFIGKTSLLAQSDDIYSIPKKNEEIPDNPPSENAGPLMCNNPSSEDCPYDDEPTRYIGINIHFLMNAAGELNFTETGDGLGGPLNGYQRAEQIVEEANRQLQENSQQWSIDPAPPVCEINFEIVLKGVYFHRTNQAFDASAQAFDPIAIMNSFVNPNLVNGTSEINIFMFEATKHSGEANGTHATVHDVFDTYHNGELASNPPDMWYLGLAGRVLVHEIFHNNGIWSHPFQGDMCDDTPTINPPCWACWPPDPQANNNLMDVGGVLDWALSPCQICMLNEGFQGQFVTISEHCAPPNAFFSMPSEVCGQFNPTVWMQGSASFNEDKHFIEIYEVPEVGNSDVISGTYSSHWFEGKVGNLNLRDYACYAFECGKTYRIKLAVSNECGDWDEQIQFVTIKCFCDEPVPEPPVYGLEINPNPVDGQATISFNLDYSKDLKIEIFNLYTGTFSKNVVDNQMFLGGENQIIVNLQNLSEGQYFVRVIDSEGFVTKQFQIQH